MKKLLAIAVATALTAPAAMADTTLYGKLHASVGTVEDVTVSGTTATTRDETRVESHASRLGVKGSNELDNGLSATYGLEYGIDIDGENKTLGARNTFVGVKGGFGEVRVGRHDTPAKLATASMDSFADTYADMSNIIATDGHRLDNAVAYINKFGPVGVALAHSTDPLVISGTTPAAPAGTGDDAAGPDNTAANTLMLNYSTGPIYAGLGYTDIDNVGNMVNLGVGYKAEAGHFANVVYEQAEGDNAFTAPATLTGGFPQGTKKDTNMYVSGGVKSGAMTFKAGYGKGERDGAGEEEQTTVGVDYALGKKTNAYLMWNDNTNLNRVASGPEASQTATVVGIVSDF